ncbi:immunoglobulin domain-containing protein [Oleiharenicola lentus]|uniref:NHL domain-containing protein n=1 Tax=Oleiharenicola lentus TaxID=2508720 RepID=UPI003F66B833
MNFSLMRLFLATSSVVAVCGLRAESFPVYRWSTIAGRSSVGSEDGVALSARFNAPHGLARDSAGNIYVADTDNHSIRKISTDGVVSTLAGSSGKSGSLDGNGAAARFKSPKGVAVDPNGNVYVSDAGNFLIRKISPAGDVTTLAGQAGKSGNANGSASMALFEKLDQITVDASGGVYVTDNGIRHIAGGTVQTIFQSIQLTTGNGLAVTIAPSGSLTCSPAGELFFAGHAVPVSNASFYLYTHRLMKRSAAGVISIVASADYSDPAIFLFGSNLPRIVAMATDAAGRLYFAFHYLSTTPIYHLAMITGDERIILKGNVVAHSGAASVPLGLAVDAAGTLFYTRDADSAIFKVTTGVGPRLLAGTETNAYGTDGAGNAARFAGITHLQVDRNGDALVTDTNLRWFQDDGFYSGVNLRKVTPAGNVRTAYTVVQTISPGRYASGLAVDRTNNIMLSITDYYARFTRIASDGRTSMIERGDFNYPSKIAFDAADQLLAAESRRIHRRNHQGAWEVLAGANASAEIKDGTGADARFSAITALTTNTGGEIFVLDQLPTSATTTRTALRRVQSSGTVTTLRADLSQPVGTISDYPLDLAVNSRGEFVLVYDRTIRLLTSIGNNVILGGANDDSTTRDGTGENARFDAPLRVAVDAQNNLFVSDNYGQTLRRGEFLGYSPDITTQPRSLSVSAGSSAQFSVMATGATHYQWSRNGEPINGATSSTLTLPNVTASHDGNYTVAVGNDLGAVSSEVAVLAITTNSNPPAGGNGGSGGGGSPSLWFLAALLMLAAARTRFKRDVRFGT